MKIPSSIFIMNDHSSNSSFSLTLVCPTSGENLPWALRRIELTSKAPGMGVDDLCSSQGFCRLPPVAPFFPLGVLGMERGSEPLLPKSIGQSSDISVMFWNDALFLIGNSAATNMLLLFDDFSSSFSNLRSILTVLARSLELPLESRSSLRGVEVWNLESLFSIPRKATKLKRSNAFRSKIRDLAR